MKHLLACVVVIAAACKKESEPAPKVETKPVAVEEPKPEPTPAPTPPPPTEPAADCVITVQVTADKVKYEGGGVTGEVPLTAGAAPDLVKLAALAGKCATNIKAAPEVGYQDVINVMDSAMKQGLKDIWLGDGPKPAAAAAAPPQPEFKMEKTDDNVMMCGRFEAPTAPAVKAAPVIILTKTDVQVDKKKVGKVDDPALGDAIGKALPPKPADPTIIVQADASLKYGTIANAIKAAETAGYTNVLFAVKNKG